MHFILTQLALKFSLADTVCQGDYQLPLAGTYRFVLETHSKNSGFKNIKQQLQSGIVICLSDFSGTLAIDDGKVR